MSEIMLSIQEMGNNLISGIQVPAFQIRPVPDTREKSGQYFEVSGSRVFLTARFEKGARILSFFSYPHGINQNSADNLVT